MRVPHLAWFQKLAETEEATDEWNEITAGLVVLRLFDSLVMFGSRALKENRKGIKNIRKAIQVIERDAPVREILLEIVKTLDSQKFARWDILKLFMDYSILLKERQQYPLAIDVLETLLGGIPADRSNLRLIVNMDLAACFRSQGDTDSAAQIYAEAGQIAASLGDSVIKLELQVIDAQIAVERGHIQQAELLLDDVLTQTKDVSEMQGTRQKALHAQAVVYLSRGEYEQSLRCGWDGFLLDDANAEMRDAILANLSSALLGFGHAEACRDGLLLVLESTDNTEMQAGARVNLIEVSVGLRDAALFDAISAAIDEKTLPIGFRASYYLWLGRGHSIFGRKEAARDTWTRGLAAGNVPGESDERPDIEAGLALLDQGLEYTPAPPQPSSPLSMEVAKNVQAMWRDFRNSNEAAPPS